MQHRGSGKNKQCVSNVTDSRGKYQKDPQVGLKYSRQHSRAWPSWKGTNQEAMGKRPVGVQNIAYLKETPYVQV